MTTFPPGIISPWGIRQALTNQATWISYKGADGTLFHLMGPLAPVPGAQNGMVIQKFMGLMAPFENLELRGARQDGATWTDTVYDVGDIMFSLEASGITPQGIRDVIRYWISAWDPRRTGVLSVFTPDMGEWWANVRPGKDISDMFTKDYTWSGKQQFTWSIKNYDAFWYSVDSTCEFDIAYANETSYFPSIGNGNTLGGTWTQFYIPTGTISEIGRYGIGDNVAQWLSPNAAADVINLYENDSASDNQVITIRLAPAGYGPLFDVIDPGASVDIWARLSSDGTSGVRLRIKANVLSLSFFIDGDEHGGVSRFMLRPPLWNDTFTLTAGTSASPYNFVVQRNGFKIWEFTDWNHTSQKGSSYRGWGFGASTGVFVHTPIAPVPIIQWHAADNLVLTQTGFVQLSNRGDIAVWPRYLVYGPGTFSIGNPGTSNVVTIGPLLDGQIILLTTEPRFRSIVDLSPTQPAPPSNLLTKFKQLLSQLISFATNNNTPPLLRQFESTFGLVPPQGNLYNLMDGRFTNPIPGSSYGSAPTTYQIPVTITNGSPISKVVAAITPMRRWPL